LNLSRTTRVIITATNRLVSTTSTNEKPLHLATLEKEENGLISRINKNPFGPIGYDINKDIMGIEMNTNKNLSEVSQTYPYYQVKEISNSVLNKNTGLNEIKVGLQVDYEVPETPKLPMADPRDSHLPEFQSAETKFWKNSLIEKVEKMKKTRYMFIEGSELRPILKHVFGAKEEDFEELEHVCDNMNHDPHLPFRKSSTYRLLFDMKLGVARRGTRVPFVLGAEDGFKRDDTGVHRFFGEVQDWVLQNSAFQALQRFKAFVIYGTMDSVQPRNGCDPNRNWNQVGFFLRVMSTPNIVGDPTSEGVHQDGVEYSMSTLFKSQNMDWDRGSAVSSLVNLDQEFGTAYDELNFKNIVDAAQHRNFLDTLIFVDNELSHVVTPLKVLNEKAAAHRDMSVIFTRRLASKNGNFSATLFDTETSHNQLPCSFSVKSKHLAECYPDEHIQVCGEHEVH